MFGRCGRQDELAAAVRAGHWPQGCEEGLRAHVAECRSCGDFALVAGTLQQAKAASVNEARVASPGTLWWRAQLRRRNEAMSQMARPIVVAEWCAFAAALIALGISVWQWYRADSGSSMWSTLVSLIGSAIPAPAEPVTGPMLLVVLAAVGALLLFGGVAVYLATSRE